MSVKKEAERIEKVKGREHRRGRDLLASLAIAACAALLSFLLSLAPSLDVFESKSLDLRFQRRGEVDRSDSDVLLIYVDEDSLEFYRDTLGRWPWPREAWAQILDYVAAGNPRAVALDILFREPDLDNPASDAALAEATARTGMVTHVFTLTDGGGEPTEALARHARPVEGKPPSPLHSFDGGDLPLASLVESAAGLGVVNFTPDADGPARRTDLVYLFRDRTYPSLALAVAGDLLADRGTPYVYTKDGHLKVGGTPIPLTTAGRFLINWQGGQYPFPYLSVGTVIDSLVKESRGREPAVPAAFFRDKVVLVGASAAGTKDLRANPFNAKAPGVDLSATIIDNILQQDFLRRLEHPWPFLLCLLLAVPVALMIVAGHGRRSLLLLAALLLLLYPAVAHVLFVRSRLWIPLVFPLLAGFLSFTSSYVYNYATEAREKKWIKNALGRCVPAQVAEEIARDPDFLSVGGSERREVTTLFTDIRGFTPLTEKLEPEEVVHMLTRYFTAMVEVIFAHGGTLKQFVGDEIMVIFGAPQNQPDHALAAARCGLRMHESLARLNAEFEEEGRPPIHTGIGLNTGLVVAGFVGAEQRLEYAVVGDPVNLASRLEGLTKEYKVPIIISSHTLDKIRELADVTELDTVRVKGKEEPVTIYHLKGLKEDGGEKS